jgi:hypothetical protein
MDLHHISCTLHVSALTFVPHADEYMQDLFTIGACAISWLFRKGRQATSQSYRDDDHTFSLPIELLGALGWLGVVISMVWEGTHPLYKGEFDSIAVTLTVMSGIEL